MEVGGRVVTKWGLMAEGLAESVRDSASASEPRTQNTTEGRIDSGKLTWDSWENLIVRTSHFPKYTRITWGIIKTKTSSNVHEGFFVIKR